MAGGAPIAQPRLCAYLARWETIKTTRHSCGHTVDRADGGALGEAEVDERRGPVTYGLQRVPVRRLMDVSDFRYPGLRAPRRRCRTARVRACFHRGVLPPRDDHIATNGQVDCSCNADLVGSVRVSGNSRVRSRLATGDVGVPCGHPDNAGLDTNRSRR